MIQIYGIDFTSRPTKRRPITCLACSFEDGHLHAGRLQQWTGFEEFEVALRQPGPWITGIDMPFGHARCFIETAGWPRSWSGCVDHVAAMTRQGFRDTLDAYRTGRPAGDKEHRRATDVAAGAISSQKLYGTPVGLMFFEGVPRIKAAGVTIPLLQRGDPGRIVIEAYPGVLARHLIGRRSYKQDTKAKQTPDQLAARKDLLDAIKAGALKGTHGFSVEAGDALVEEPGADPLDALLCAVQATWAWTRRASNFGAPADTDMLEGWIAEPILRPR